MLGIEFFFMFDDLNNWGKNSINHQTIIEKIYVTALAWFSNVKHAIQNSNLNYIFIHCILHNNFMLLLAHVDY